MTVRFEDGPGSDCISLFNTAGTHIGTLRKHDGWWRYHATRAVLDGAELVPIIEKMNRLNNPNRLENIEARRESAGTGDDPYTIENEPCC